jgi:hypothetical protein
MKSYEQTVSVQLRPDVHFHGHDFGRRVRVIGASDGQRSPIDRARMSGDNHFVGYRGGSRDALAHKGELMRYGDVICSGHARGSTAIAISKPAQFRQSWTPNLYSE